MNYVAKTLKWFDGIKIYENIELKKMPFFKYILRAKLNSSANVIFLN